MKWPGVLLSAVLVLTWVGCPKHEDPEPPEDVPCPTLPAGEAARLIKDINPLGASSNPRNLTEVNGILYFSADDGVHGSELWKSNGTAECTVLVKDLSPGPGPGSPQSLTNLDGTLYFTADDGVHGSELWKSDGTAQGTVLVQDFFRGPTELMAFQGALYFNAHDGVHGEELWKSDGTPEGTVLFKEFNTTLGGSDVGNLTNVNGTLYLFSGWGDLKLWKSDGTPEGTVLVKSLPMRGGGRFRFFPEELTNVQGTLYFSATIVPTNVITGYELWKSDGTAEGTVLVKDIYPDYLDSSPRQLTDVNGTLYFIANDGVHGRELWKSDGTSEGTVLVKDISPGTGAGVQEPAGPLTNLHGTLYFTADDGVHGEELWKSDGTSEGTVLVKDFNPGPGSGSPRSLKNAQGTLYFSADDGVHGAELWKSDGTAEGTVLVQDFNPGLEGAFPVPMLEAGGKLFFTATTPAEGKELWIMDAVPTP